jgi:phage gpG-like protein
VQAELRRRIAKLTDLSGPNRKVAIVLDRWVQRNFKTQGGHVGGWTPFKRGGRPIPGGGIDTSAQLLQDTGALRLSFRMFWDSKRAGIGSRLKYSKPHEEGTSRLPQRRMLPEEADVIQPILRVYENHVASLTRLRLW